VADFSKAPKGESASDRTARQKKFYTQQRVRAEETGDQATVDKIYGKLGKKSHSVDADAVNKDILGGVASTMGLRGLGKIGSAMKGASLAGKASKSLGEGRKALGAQKALTGGGRSASSVKKMHMKALTGGKGPSKVGKEPIVSSGGKAPGSQNKPIYRRGTAPAKGEGGKSSRAPRKKAS
jgi:hypothetical protein